MSELRGFMEIEDTIAKEIRSKNMAAIKGKDTKPEIVVRKFLWANGFRYRLNHPRLPGKPDVVLRKYRTCVFVNGCFWHGHDIHTFTSDTITSSDIGISKSKHNIYLQ
jgi:DNA mismatch endonuclease (patch repair protein)